MGADSQAPEAPRILLVEVVPHLQGIVHSHVAPRGPWIGIERDVKEAWKRVKRELPDLVIVDLSHGLPGGIELCRTLLADATTRGVRLIAVCAPGPRDVLTRPDLGELADWLVRPWDLLRAVDSALDEKRREASLTART